MSTHATLQFLAIYASIAAIIFAIYVYMDWERKKRRGARQKQQDLLKASQNQMQCQTAQYIPYVVAPGCDEPASYPIAPSGAYRGPEPQPPDSDFVSSGSQEFN